MRETSLHAPLSSSSRSLLRHALASVLSNLHRHANAITLLDTAVGDGDCGVTFAKGADSIQQNWSYLPTDDLAATLFEISQTISNSMGGTSGVLYRVFLTTTARKLDALAQEKQKLKTKKTTKKTKQQEEQADEVEGELDALEVLEAVEAGLCEVEKLGGSREGDRSMIDAWRPALTAFKTAVQDGKPLSSCLESASVAAEKGVQNTKDMTPRVGRTSYVSSSTFKNVADPGAMAAWAIIDGAHRGSLVWEREQRVLSQQRQMMQVFNVAPSDRQY